MPESLLSWEGTKLLLKFLYAALLALIMSIVGLFRKLNLRYRTFTSSYLSLRAQPSELSDRLLDDTERGLDD